MQETTNFKFLQPEGTDNVLVSILNENMDKVDAILTDIYSKLPTPRPVVSLPYTINVSDLIDNPSDESSMMYINSNIEELNMSTDKKYQCTIVDNSDNEYVFGVGPAGQGVYTESSEQGITGGNVGWWGTSAPELPTELRSLSSIYLTNGISIDFETGSYQDFGLVFEVIVSSAASKEVFKSNAKCFIIDEIAEPDSTITLPDDIDGTSGPESVYGTIENKGNLGLTVGTSYKITVEAVGQTFTATVSAGDYGNGIVELSVSAGQWQVGYLHIYDNASISGDVVSANTDTYAFSWSISEGISATVTVEEA